MYFYQAIAILLFSFVMLVVVSEAQEQHSHLDSAIPVMGLFLYVPLSVLIVGGALAFRNRALRIVVLRPFDERELTRGLKRLVVRHLGPAGLVFTLSDRNYKPSLVARLALAFQTGPGLIVYAAVTYVVGPLLHYSRRIRSVSRKSEFYALAHKLCSRVQLNYWALLSGNAAFNIRCADDWWKMCVHLLINSCELIMIDLSKVKEGMIWELGRLKVAGKVQKCIFIVNEEQSAHATRILRDYFGPDRSPTIYAYSSDGKIKERSRFDEQLYSILKSGLNGTSAV